MILSLIFKRWREGVIGVLLVVVFLSLMQWKKADNELKKVRLAFENPATKEYVKETTASGPAITYTRTWTTTAEPTPPIQTARRPRRRRAAPPAEITETIQWQAQQVSVKESGRESTPIPVGTILAGTRTDRWLLTLGVNRFSGDLDGKMLLAGYGWRNRFDLQAGLIRDDETRPWVVGTIRF